MRRHSKTKALFVFICFILYVIFLFGNIKLPNILIYNHTQSIPVGWYFIFKTDKYEVGDIVGYDIPNEIRQLSLDRGWLQKSDIVMKRIGALKGDSFEIKNDQFWVNEKYIGSVFKQDSNNVPLPNNLETGRYIVPEDEFLPLTTHPFSFDGRYYGTVKIEKIKFKAIPITAF